MTVLQPPSLLPDELVARLEEDGLLVGRTLWASLLEADPARTAVVCPRNGAITYAELRRDAEGLASYWHETGLRPGDVVVLQLPNWYEMVLAHLALTRLGAVTLPLLPTFRERELRHVLARSSAVGIVAAPTFRASPPAELYARLLAETPTLAWVIEVDGAPTLRDLARTEPRDDLPPLPDPEALTILMATSGTTAEPKLVMHTHRSTIGGVLQSVARSVMTLGGDDVMLMPSPLAHATGIQYGTRLAVVLGVTLVLQDRWDPVRAAELIEEHGATWFMGATPFLFDLVSLPPEGLARLGTLRLFVCGGAPLPDTLAADATERLPGVALMAAWGLSETGIVTLVRPDDPVERVVRTDGAPVPGWEVAIIDPETLESLPVGTEGEIVCRGGGLFHGYAGRPDLTEAVLVDGGWFRTGDLGVIDADGYLDCLGRIKDQLVRGGMNVSALEVEEAILRHPDVTDVAVIGVPDPRLGERICAVVVLADAADLDLDRLVAFLEAEGMSRLKFPEILEITDALPRTPIGKVQKYQLRETYAAALGPDGGAR